MWVPGSAHVFLLVSSPPHVVLLPIDPCWVVMSLLFSLLFLGPIDSYGGLADWCDTVEQGSPVTCCQSPTTSATWSNILQSRRPHPPPRSSQSGRWHLSFPCGRWIRPAIDVVQGGTRLSMWQLSNRSLRTTNPSSGCRKWPELKLDLVCAVALVQWDLKTTSKVKHLHRSGALWGLWPREGGGYDGLPIGPCDDAVELGWRGRPGQLRRSRGLSEVADASESSSENHDILRRKLLTTKVGRP